MKKPVLLLTIALAAFLPFRSQAQKTDSGKKPSSFSAKVAGNGKTLIEDKDNKISRIQRNRHRSSSAQGSKE